ncbi:MAG: inositol monophosphatase family protein [Bacilli bacterium]
MNWTERCEQIQTWLKPIALKLKEGMQQQYSVETKSSRTDFVTEWDRFVEQEIVRSIREQYPEDYIVGEEGFGDDTYVSQGTGWFIDPIDGTMNFVKRRFDFAISVGVVHDGLPVVGVVYDVMRDTMYHSIRGEGAYENGRVLKPLEDVPLEEAVITLNPRWLIPNDVLDPERLGSFSVEACGIRSCAAAALELVYIARGSSHLYVNPNLKSWDYMAGLVFMNELGGKVTTLVGEELRFDTLNGVVAGTPSLVNLFHECMNKGDLPK